MIPDLPGCFKHDNPEECDFPAYLVAMRQVDELMERELEAIAVTGLDSSEIVPLYHSKNGAEAGK